MLVAAEQTRLSREWVVVEVRERAGRNFAGLEPECKRLQRGALVLGYCLLMAR